MDYLSEASRHAQLANTALLDSKDHGRTSRDHMALLNLAKTHSEISRAYAALEAADVARHEREWGTVR